LRYAKDDGFFFFFFFFFLKITIFNYIKVNVK
jgi:hypothetical protein